MAVLFSADALLSYGDLSFQRWSLCNRMGCESLNVCLKNGSGIAKPCVFHYKNSLLYLN